MAKQYPLQNLAFAIIAGLPVIAACFVALRIYARKRFGVPLGWDDYLITVAAVLSIGLITPSIKNIIIWHFGIHIWDVNPMEVDPDYDEYHRLLIAHNLIHTPILPLVKASIILLLLKVGKLIVSIRRALYVILFFIVGACLGPLIALIFLCPPKTGRNYGDSVYGGLQCLGQRSGAILYLWLVSVNLFTDLLILPIPSLLMYRVKNTSLRARCTVVFSSALILGATGIGAARLALEWQHTLHLVDKPDWTYNIAFCLNHAENNAAIILACMPILRTLIIRWNHDGTNLGSDVRSRRVHRGSVMLRSGESPTAFEYRKEKSSDMSVDVNVAGGGGGGGVHHDDFEDDIEDIEEEWKRYNSELSEFTEFSEASTSSTEVSLSSPPPMKLRPESKFYDSDEDGTIGICGSHSSYSK